MSPPSRANKRNEDKMALNLHVTEEMAIIKSKILKNCKKKTLHIKKNMANLILIAGYAENFL
jgi:hypothetical protein